MELGLNPSMTIELENLLRNVMVWMLTRTAVMTNVAEPPNLTAVFYMSVSLRNNLKCKCPKSSLPHTGILCNSWGPKNNNNRDTIAGGLRNGQRCPPDSCACLSQIGRPSASSQVSQNFKRDLGLALLGSQPHHGRPMGSRDAALTPPAHHRAKLRKTISGAACAAESVND